MVGRIHLTFEAPVGGENSTICTPLIRDEIQFKLVETRLGKIVLEMYGKKKNRTNKHNGLGEFFFSVR